MKHRVLIVEDDEVFLRPLQRTLEVAGDEILIVPSGEDAIDLLKRDDVELVLTDKRLPGIDGVELVRRLKAEHADLAAVAMTAYGTIGSAVEAMRVGAEDDLVKPFDTAEALMVVRRPGTPTWTPRTSTRSSPATACAARPPPGFPGRDERWGLARKCGGMSSGGVGSPRSGPRRAPARPRSAPGFPGRDERWGLGGHVEAPM